MKLVSGLWYSDYAWQRAVPAAPLKEFSQFMIGIFVLLRSLMNVAFSWQGFEVVTEGYYVRTGKLCFVNCFAVPKERTS